jgi:hypothetical protein
MVASEPGEHRTRDDRRRRLGTIAESVTEKTQANMSPRIASSTAT